MSDLNHSMDTLGVAVTRQAPEGDIPPDVPVWYHGRVLGPEEQAVIEDAYRQARDREAVIVSGVGQKREAA